MNVNPVSGGLVTKAYPTIRREIPSDAGTQSTTGTDVVDLTGQTQSSPQGIRADKVAAVKAAIANGTYETDDKLNGAVNNLLDEVVS
jgi:anti-sigma28 factor (negative regulator of flagellin synthesis)